VGLASVSILAAFDNVITLADLSLVLGFGAFLVFSFSVIFVQSSIH
jgi:hypothetical protein